MNITYTKTIRRKITESIEIIVHRNDGSTPLYDIVQGFPFESSENKFKRAHRIADMAIATMKKQECFDKAV